MIRGRRLAAWLLLVAALGLAALGQYYFFSRREYLWDGVVLHGLAVACFLWAWRLDRQSVPHAARHRPAHVGTWLRKRPIPAALLGNGEEASTSPSGPIRKAPYQVVTRRSTIGPVPSRGPNKRWRRDPARAALGVGVERETHIYRGPLI